MKKVWTIRTVENGWIIERHHDNKSCFVISTDVSDSASVFNSLDRAIAYLRKEMKEGISA